MTLNQGYENILCVEFMFEWQHEFYTKHSILKGSENIVLDEIKEIKFSLTVSKERISIDSFFIKSPDFEDFRFKDHYIIFENNSLQDFKNDYNNAINDYLHDFYSDNLKHRGFVFDISNANILKDESTELSLEVIFESGKKIIKQKQYKVRSNIRSK